jgi:hypothetical protein
VHAKTRVQPIINTVMERVIFPSQGPKTSASVGGERCESRNRRFVTLLARLLPHIDMGTGAAPELGMCLMVR